MTTAKSNPGRKSPNRLNRKTVGVIGLGQIGGSILKSLSSRCKETTLIGHDRDAGLRTKVRRHAGWADSIGEIVSASDMLILAVPVPAILRLLPKVAGATESRTRSDRLIVFDTGTIKSPVVRAAARFKRQFDFVGLHPLSGGERNGWVASRADLFVGDRIICCARGKSMAESIAHELIGLLGANVVHIDPVSHDRMIATTIGLPHMLAFAAQGLPARSGAVQRLHGRSWGTLTRVAVSDPAMVGGFLCTNAKEQARIARLFQKRLDQIIAALDDPSGRKIESLLRRWRITPSGLR